MKIYSILLSLMVILGALPLSFASGIAENVAVVVSTPADAIVAAPYAKAMGYKLIYTPTGELSDDAKRELERNNIDKVIIVGGSVAVSTNVENQIKGLKITTQRVWGETRIETSQKMYELIKAEKPELLDNLVVVEGFNEKISPVAVSFGAPVLYYGLGKDEGLAKILETAKPKNAIIIGSGAPRIIENTLSKNAENTIIASGSDDSAVRTALAYVTKINPNAENKDVAVVYAEKTNNPILDAVVSFVNGYVGSIAPIPKSDEGIISNIVSKLTFSSGISISSDDTSLSNIVSNIATTHGLSSTGITSSGGGGGTSSTSTSTPTVDNKPVINKFEASIDGLKATFIINVSDDNGLKKIVLKYGDGTEQEKDISGKSYYLNTSRNYLMQGIYTAKLEVYDDNGQLVSESDSLNLRYFDVNQEYISKVTENVDESIPITITNYHDTAISIINTTNVSSDLSVSMSGDLTVDANSNEIVVYNITNTSALGSGKSYQASITFALDGHPEINKTFTLDIAVPEQQDITTSNGSTVSLQVVNTTVADTTNITINDSKTDVFSITTTVSGKTIEFAVPTTNTSNTSAIENTTIHLENVKDALDRAEEIQNTSTLTEELMTPVVIASKDVNNVSVDINNITFDETTNEATINTEIVFENTTDTYVVIAIPVGNNSVSEVFKEGLGDIPAYDQTKDQPNYYNYDATHGIVTLYMTEDPLLSITLSVNVTNDPSVVLYNYTGDGLNVLINASESYDPENKTLTFTWLAPDNRSFSYLDGGKTINITYPVDGTYDITLTVSDGVYEVTSVITVSLTQPVEEKPAIKVIADDKIVEFEGQDSNTLSITGTKTINIPTITADATVVDKKDTTKNVEICFKDNESFESVIEAMNNFNKVSYDGDTITITYNNADMNGKNVSLNIITTRDTFRDNINALLDGNATGLINSLNTSYINTATVSSGKAEFTINADDSKADYFVIITEGNGVKTTDDDVKILAIGGFEVMKYNLTLTFNRTDVNNQSFYNMSLNDTPTNDVRYGLARIDKTVGIKLNVVGTNPNNNLFNVSVVGNSGSEIIVENNDFITLSAKKIQDISGTIFNSAASVSYSDEITKENKDTLKVKNISNAYVIGVVYDTVDKKIVAVEQQ